MGVTEPTTDRSSADSQVGDQAVGADHPTEIFFDAERLKFFSDAVVAIALTLLALELPVPLGQTNAGAWHSAGEHLGAYISFLISFTVIWGHWSGHHRIFRYVERVGGELVPWNMAWLLMIVLTPFAARVLTEDGAFEFRFITYAVVQALAGVFFLLTVRTAVRHRLFVADLPPTMLPTTYIRCGVLVAVFVASIPVAFVTQAAYGVWMLMPFIFRGVRAVAVRRATHRRRDRVPDGLPAR
jgi:uncharacterized membrane protein